LNTIGHSKIDFEFDVLYSYSVNSYSVKYIDSHFPSNQWAKFNFHLKNLYFYLLLLVY